MSLGARRWAWVIAGAAALPSGLWVARAGPPAGDPVVRTARALNDVSRRHLGTPYRRDPLGEGPTGTVDRDPLSDWAHVDCVTFVEQCLAEAAAPSGPDVSGVLRRIRYRDGVVCFPSRNHEMVADWLPNNRWLVEDLTARVGGRDCRRISATVDRRAFLRRRGSEGGSGPERVRTNYVPRGRLAACLSRIPDASLVIFIQRRAGILGSHCGLAFRAGGGPPVLRHASELKGRVVEEPLLAVMLRSSRRVVGLKVCGLRSGVNARGEAPRGPGRPAPAQPRG